MSAFLCTSNWTCLDCSWNTTRGHSRFGLGQKKWLPSGWTAVRGILNGTCPVRRKGTRRVSLLGEKVLERKDLALPIILVPFWRKFCAKYPRQVRKPFLLSRRNVPLFRQFRKSIGSGCSDSSWRQFGQHCYFLSTLTAKGGAEADSSCNLDSPAAKAVSIHSIEELEFIENAFQ